MKLQSVGALVSPTVFSQQLLIQQVVPEALLTPVSLVHRRRDNNPRTPGDLRSGRVNT